MAFVWSPAAVVDYILKHPEISEDLSNGDYKPRKEKPNLFCGWNRIIETSVKIRNLMGLSKQVVTLRKPPVTADEDVSRVGNYRGNLLNVIYYEYKDGNGPRIEIYSQSLNRMDSDIVFATSRPSPGSVNRPVVGKAEIDIYRPSNFFHPYPWELRLELAVMLSPVRKLFD